MHRHHHLPGMVNQTEFVWINTRHCKGCWQCIKACPNNVLGKADFLLHRHVRVNNPLDCQGCMACVKACDRKAIRALKTS